MKRRVEIVLKLATNGQSDEYINKRIRIYTNTTDPLVIYPTGRIRACKIRFVSTGENRRKPCLVCKKKLYRNRNDSDGKILQTENQ